jgi:pyruvate dehydrogenase E2 component (dihydrolipoamide acetyltransferase)
MAEIVRMPKLSDTMEEGVVAEWHKKVGDEVKAGDLLAEIETDKATMEFESFQDGVLLHIGVGKGDAAPVDSILAVLGKKGEDIKELLAGEGAENGAAQKENSSDEKEASTVKEKDSSEEESQEEEGQEEEGQEEKEEAPKPKEQNTGASKAQNAENKGAPPKEKSSESVNDGRIKASPLARKMAEDKGVDLNQVNGTGDAGRIVMRDIENFSPAAAKVAPAGVATGEERYTEEKVSQMRKTIAKRLSESKFTAPHFYLTMEVDMDRAMEQRQLMNEALAPAKVSFNDLIIKAVAAALRKHPKVNAAWLGDKIRYSEHIHIGVAVAVDEGLLVPVVKFADSKSLLQINDEVKVFAEKARNKKLQPSDWEGNTFTISNLGMFGIEEFTAIINSPDACIMAVGTIVQKPVVKKDQIVIGNTMKVTLSCDHRVVDGVVGSAFLQTFKQYMENPVLIIAG